MMEPIGGYRLLLLVHSLGTYKYHKVGAREETLGSKE
jgi:hypothetical protein